MEQDQDRFKMAMGILIAFVAFITAIAAWRAAVAARTAGLEDYYAVTSVLNAQETQTLNTSTAIRHLNAFTQFAIHDEYLNELLNVSADSSNEEQRAMLEEEIAQTDRLAATNRNFFPARYVTKDGSYQVQREMAEQFSEAERRQDLSPDAHLARAAGLDNKTFAFISTIIVLSGALLLFTLASAWHPQQRILRLGSAALGILLMIYSVAQIIMTEYS